MEIRFTPEQEARLTQMAGAAGVEPAQLLLDAASRLIEDEARFREAVRVGVEQADRGEFIDEEEMDDRVARMLRP
jgi:predicted transcriptional regulator